MRTLLQALGVPILLLSLLASPGCGTRAVEDQPSPAERRTTAAGKTAPPANGAADPASAGVLAAEPGADDPLAGEWWVLTPSHPYLALRLNLVGTDDEGKLEGNWVSFDWRATTQAESLVRKSKAVRVDAAREGEPGAPTLLMLDGPTPMLDENNVPNGQRGEWHIELRPNNLPGEGLRFQGRGVQDVLAAGDGVTVDLVREFRPWKP